MYFVDALSIPRPQPISLSLNCIILAICAVSVFLFAPPLMGTRDDECS